MMITVKNGDYSISVYSGGYMDWGVMCIEVESGEIIFDNPHFLSCESYGHFEPEEGEEQAKEWSEDDWKECIKDEFDELLDIFIDHHKMSQPYNQ